MNNKERNKHYEFDKEKILFLLAIPFVLIFVIFRPILFPWKYENELPLILLNIIIFLVSYYLTNQTFKCFPYDDPKCQNVDITLFIKLCFCIICYGSVLMLSSINLVLKFYFYLCKKPFVKDYSSKAAEECLFLVITLIPLAFLVYCTLNKKRERLTNTFRCAIYCLYAIILVNMLLITGVDSIFVFPEWLKQLVAYSDYFEKGFAAWIAVDTLIEKINENNQQDQNIQQDHLIILDMNGIKKMRITPNISETQK